MFANIFVVLHQDNIEDVIKDFIAVGVINEIDDIIATSWVDNDVEEYVAENEIWVEKDRQEFSDAKILALYSTNHPAKKEVPEEASKEQMEEIKEENEFFELYT